jgi:hypothetical protein
MPRKSTIDTGSGENSKKPVKNGGSTDTNANPLEPAIAGATWGSDTIIGTVGDDTITGIPDTGDLGLGASNQVDVLTGGTGADLFILGDSRGAFYTEGNSNTYGSGSYGDYAIITDFNPADGDRIQLYDDATYWIVYTSDISDADGDNNSQEGVYELYYYTDSGFFGVEPMAYVFTEDGVYNPTSIAQYFVAAPDTVEPTIIEL